VYPQRVQITLQRISNVGEPHTSQGSESRGGTGCGAFAAVPAMGESTRRRGLKSSFGVCGVHKNHWCGQGLENPSECADP